MSLESFYGGRMGASFIIVKQFDGINIPQEEGAYKYKAKYLAIHSIDNGVYKYEYNNGFIERDSENYNLYNWKLTDLDGTPVNIIDESIPSHLTENLPKEEAEGMVQCFKKGGASTNTVNYGEYVIIDTPDKNHPDNGKVFRRGMNYQDDLGGAEYKGQIVGPQGPAPELVMGHYSEVETYSSTIAGSFDALSQDLIPGVEGSPSTFNDEIKWITATIKDKYGNLSRCMVGFRIPYLVLEFEANSIDPYDTEHDYRYWDEDEGKWKYHNLIAKDIGADGFDVITNKWKHPFFEKWQVKVPPGLHGVNSTNIEIVHTKTKTLDMNDGKGVDYYEDQDGIKVKVGTLESSVDVLIEEFFDPERPEETTYGGANQYNPIYIEGDQYCKILLDVEGTPTEFYVKQEDCYMDIVRYRETNFDNYENGEIRFYKIGDYNDIQRITLSEEGILTVFYSAKPTPQNLEEVIRWIYNDKNQDPETRTKGIEIDDWGTLQVNYNTKKNGVREVDRFPNQLQWIKNINLSDKGTVTITYNVPDPEHPTQRKTEVFPKIIDWITDITLSQDGKFRIVFNNDSIGQIPPSDPIDPWYDPNTNPEDPEYDPTHDHQNKGQYMRTLEWIDFIDINEDGTIDFYLNTNHEEPVYTSLLRLKIIDDIEIQTTNSSGIEGTGDQKIHVTYNTEDEDNSGQKEIAIIGNPLNYIIETAVSMPSEAYPNVPYSHLLVYYSDPDLRQRLGGNISYPSSKVKDYDPSTGEPIGWHVWTEWVDLGNIRGSQNGIHIIKDVTNLDELKTDDEPAKWKKPEDLKEGAYGWSITYSHDAKVELYAYDYIQEIWYSLGTVSDVSIQPNQVIVVSHGNNNFLPDPSTITDTLVNDGYWFATETCKYAH